MKNKAKSLEIKDLKTGDILLCQPNDWVGKAIVKLTKGKVSHSAIYYGEVNGKPSLVHSHMHGMVFTSLEELFTDYKEKVCYVKRNPTQCGIDQILYVAGTYVKEGNPYSYGNLIILAMLGIFGRVSTKIIKHEDYYDFLERMASILMKHLRELIHKGKHPMTCSQFVSQCFTDGGVECDIQFKDLVVDIRLRPHNDDTTSLWEMIRQQGDECLSQAHTLTVAEQEDAGYNPEETAKLLFDLLSGNVEEEKLLSNCRKDVVVMGTKLLSILCQVSTGSELLSLSQVIDIPSSDRNFFVTPDDLYSHTKNFVDVGSIDKSILSK
ncbi:MAG: hypothetical protein LUD15_11790 [Bacteroides sp.]|nr:hypothetical protein [Bacteroides sp.]